MNFAVVFDERGGAIFSPGSTLAEERQSILAACSSEAAKKLCATGSPQTWISTFTVGLVPDKEGLQVSVSVVGNPYGTNPVSARARDWLQANACNKRFKGPILVRLETPDRQIVNPARFFPSAKEYVQEMTRIVSGFECGLQWIFCPRVVKRPLSG